MKNLITKNENIPGEENFKKTIKYMVTKENMTIPLKYFSGTDNIDSRYWDPDPEEKIFDSLEAAQAYFDEEKKYCGACLSSEPGHKSVSASCVELFEIECEIDVEDEDYFEEFSRENLDAFYGAFWDGDYFSERFRDYLSDYYSDIINYEVDWDDPNSVAKYNNILLTIKNDPLHSDLLDECVRFAVDNVYSYGDYEYLNNEDFLDIFNDIFEEEVWIEWVYECEYRNE